MAIGKTNCGGGLAAKGTIYAAGLSNPIALQALKFRPKRVMFYHCYDIELPLTPNTIVWVYADAETRKCDCMYLDGAGENFVVEQGDDWGHCAVCEIGFNAAGKLAFSPIDGYTWIGEEESTYAGYSYLAWG